MSAPRTDVETQTRWHRGPIIGMIAVVIFALVLLFWQMMKVADEGQPEGNGVNEIDGRTGESVPNSAPESAPNSAPNSAPADGTTPDGDVPTMPDGDIPAETPPAPAPPPAPIPDTNTQP